MLLHIQFGASKEDSNGKNSVGPDHDFSASALLTFGTG